MFTNRPLDYTRTQRTMRDAASYGNPISRFKRPTGSQVLDFLAAVAIGVMLGVLLAWRG